MRFFIEFRRQHGSKCKVMTNIPLCLSLFLVLNEKKIMSTWPFAHSFIRSLARSLSHTFKKFNMQIKMKMFRKHLTLHERNVADCNLQAGRQAGNVLIWHKEWTNEHIMWCVWCPSITPTPAKNPSTKTGMCSTMWKDFDWLCVL